MRPRDSERHSCSRGQAGAGRPPHSPSLTHRLPLPSLSSPFLPSLLSPVTHPCSLTHSLACSLDRDFRRKKSRRKHQKVAREREGERERERQRDGTSDHHPLSSLSPSPSFSSLFPEARATLEILQKTHPAFGERDAAPLLLLLLLRDLALLSNMGGRFSPSLFLSHEQVLLRSCFVAFLSPAARLSPRVSPRSLTHSRCRFHRQGFRQTADLPARRLSLRT